MNNIYINIIQKLESDGRFKQADLVDKYLRTAQRSNLINPLPGFFNPLTMGDSLGYYSQQLGTYNPSIVSSGGRALDLQNIYLKQLSPSELQLYKYNPAFKMQVEQAAKDTANSFAQGTGINALQSHINIIDNNLSNKLRSGMLPSQISNEYQQTFDVPLQQQIERMILSEQNVNTIVNALFTIIDRTKFLKNLPAFTNSQSGTISKAIGDALQQLKPKPDEKINRLVIVKYNSLIQHPRLRSFINPQMYPPINIT